MKKILTLLSVCLLPVLAFAQSDATTDDPIFVVDGQKVTKAKLYEVSPDDIGIVEVLKDSTTAFGDTRKNGLVRVTTKKYVIASYQKVLGESSKEYAGYLVSKAGNDDDVLYLVDGKPLTDEGNKAMLRLYAIKPEQIKNVRLGRNLAYGNIAKKYLVEITTTAEN